MKIVKHKGRWFLITTNYVYTWFHIFALNSVILKFRKRNTIFGDKE